MSGRHDLAVTLPWMRDGTAHVLRLVDALTDDDVGAPSALPGWTRAHVVGHLARNAEALTRLATWARTGVATPMYGSRAERDAEIEESATRPPRVLRADATGSAVALEEALDALSDAGWSAMVRSAQGREIPAAEIPWLRIREVWLHAVDLGTGASVDDLPAGVVDLLLDDVVATLSTKPDCPQARLVPIDRDRTWQLGADDGPTGSGPEVRGPAARLAGWLTGRAPAPSGSPALPAWL